MILRNLLIWLPQLALAVLLAGCSRTPPEPIAKSQATLTLERGHELYQRMCSVCHGKSGEGYKADQAPRLRSPNFLASATDEFLSAAIAHGREGTTMSAWARERGGPLDANEVRAVIAYIRSFGSKLRRSDDKPHTGSSIRGQEVYARECASCHGPNARGGPAPHIGDAEFLATANDGFLRIAITEGRPQTSMPAFKNKLGVQGIEDVIALLRSWQTPKITPKLPAKPPPIPLGKVAINAGGPTPNGFKRFPEMTNVDIVQRELARGAVLGLLDARAPSDYLREHITGAVSVPFYDPGPYFAQLPKDIWLVCYCGCPHAESGKLAQQLLDKGFTKVTVLNEGLGFWKSKKYGVSSGEKP